MQTHVRPSRHLVTVRKTSLMTFIRVWGIVLEYRASNPALSQITLATILHYANIVPNLKLTSLAL